MFDSPRNTYTRRSNNFWARLSQNAAQTVPRHQSDVPGIKENSRGGKDLVAE